MQIRYFHCDVLINKLYKFAVYILQIKSTLLCKKLQNIFYLLLKVEEWSWNLSKMNNGSYKTMLATKHIKYEAINHRKPV